MMNVRMMCLLLVSTIQFTSGASGVESLKPSPKQINGEMRKVSLPVVYMSENCKPWRNKYAGKSNPYIITVATLVELTPSTQSVSSMECIVTFKASSPSQRLLLHFESVNINYNPGTFDRLHIYDGALTYFDNQLTPNRGLYGKYYKGIYEFSSGGIHDYRSSGQSLTLSFEGSSSQAFSGFKALITVFTDTNKNGSCDHDLFRCAWSETCIPPTMVCSGYQNCGEGDLSNLDNCSPKLPHHTSHVTTSSSDLGLMVGCAISIVILLIVLIWLVIVCLKRTKLGRRRRRYLRHAPGPNEVEGSVVEPVQPRRLLTPFLSFFEPPPVYSEHQDGRCGVTPTLAPQFELPPPYSVDEHDTAGLISNEALHSASPSTSSHYGNFLPTVHAITPHRMTIVPPHQQTHAPSTLPPTVSQFSRSIPHVAYPEYSTTNMSQLEHARNDVVDLSENLANEIAEQNHMREHMEETPAPAEECWESREMGGNVCNDADDKDEEEEREVEELTPWFTTREAAADLNQTTDSVDSHLLRPLATQNKDI